MFKRNDFVVSLRFAAFNSNCVEGVAAKTNWRGKNMKYEFKTTSLLPNQKYEFKIVLVYHQFKSLSFKKCLSVDNSRWKCDGERQRDRETERQREREMQIKGSKL